MNKVAVFSALAAAAALTSVSADAGRRLSPAQQLDKALAGRVAGKPVDCIDPRTNTDTQVIDRTAIIYGSGRTIYVQTPDGADSLRDDQVLVTELRGSGQLCSIDVVKLHDRTGGWYEGFVGLNKFVPYTKVAVKD